MGFQEFVGNHRVVSALRRMLAADRVPNALLFAGPRGIGKYTLARMFAAAANCENQKDDFCGRCEPCRRIALLAEPVALIEQGLTERGENPDAATVERIPLILQTHPDVWALVPDPVRLRNPVVRPMIRMGQLRAIQRAAYFRPQGRRRVFILDSAETMRWDFANIFLKILEEPPESATLILLAPRPDALLPTIRSRCLQFHLAPVPAADVETFLKSHSEFKAAERKLAALLSGGCPGVALGLDLQESARVRKEVLAWLELAASGKSLADLFAQSEQLVKGEKDSFENLLDLFYSLLNDLLELSCGPSKVDLRNPDLKHQLEALSKTASLEWVEKVVGGLDELHMALRRNVNRQLGLDAIGARLG